MADREATLSVVPAALDDALQLALALRPTSEGQTTAQREIVASLQAALDARRQRIIVSESARQLGHVVGSGPRGGSHPACDRVRSERKPVGCRHCARVVRVGCVMRPRPHRRPGSPVRRRLPRAPRRAPAGLPPRLLIAVGAAGGQHQVASTIVEPCASAHDLRPSAESASRLEPEQGQEKTGARRPDSVSVQRLSMRFREARRPVLHAATRSAQPLESSAARREFGAETIQRARDA